MALLLMGLALAEAATSCTTRWDAGLQCYLTPLLGWLAVQEHLRPRLSDLANAGAAALEALQAQAVNPSPPGGTSPRHALVSVYRYHGVLISECQCVFEGGDHSGRGVNPGGSTLIKARRDEDHGLARTYVLETGRAGPQMLESEARRHRAEEDSS
jgi:hypothetical protein